jgi:hypothetical protein
VCAAVLTLAPACSSTICDRQKCAQDAPRLEDERKQCQESIASKCGVEQEAYARCLYDAQVCGADYKTDRKKTEVARASACASQKQDLDTCLAAAGSSP